MIIFSDINDHQDLAENIHEKIISSETEYGWAEDPVSMHRTASNETALVWEIPVWKRHNRTRARKKTCFQF